MAPICGCTLDIYRYRECRHYSNPVKKVCWRADYRANVGCLSAFFPCGKPTKVKNSRDGICDDCKVFFAQFGELSAEVKRSFFAYKEARGWRKKRVKPENVAPDNFINPHILEAINSRPLAQPQPFRPHSPMCAAPSREGGDHLAPLVPAVRKTKSHERRAKRRRARTPFENETKPASECSEEPSASGHNEPINRAASTTPCSVVRNLMIEAERMYPNPESEMYPGVPKLSAPPKRRFPRSAVASPQAAAAPAPTVVVPAVVLDQRPIGRLGISARAGLLGAPASQSFSALVRSLALDVAAFRPKAKVPVSSTATSKCKDHRASHDFSCTACRSALLRERGVGEEEETVEEVSAKSTGSDAKQRQEQNEKPKKQQQQEPTLRRCRRVSAPNLVVSFASPEEKLRFEQKIGLGWI